MDNALSPERDELGLAEAIDLILEKGLVINADITVDVAGVELLGIKLRAALASFETAARYGLEFPTGVNTQTAAWRSALVEKEVCPQCGKRVDREELLEESCPWCGWRSAKTQRVPYPDIYSKPFADLKPFKRVGAGEVKVE
jgi:ribosomal protein L37AE/L43A